MMCVMAAGLFMLTACNNKQPEAAATETTMTESNSEPAKPEIKLADLSDKTDHVCGMELAEGGIADTAHLGDKVYGFCAAECKAEFVKDPAKYIAQQ